MDPITTAIVAALGQLGANVIKDTYSALKAAIAQKCGVDSDMVSAIENVEKKPNSKGRKETLQEEVDAAEIKEDPEILNLAQSLLDELKKLDASREFPNSSTIITQQAGDNATQIGQVSGDVNIEK